MKKYEAVYILDEQLIEDQGEKFTTELQSLIESFGGNLEVTNPMGRRQFATPIRKKATGLYWDYEFTLPEAKLADLKSHFSLDKKVLRNEIFIFDRPEVTVIKRVKPDGDDDHDTDEDDDNED